MTTTIFSSSVTTSGPDPIFTFAESGDRLIVDVGVTLSTLGDYAVYAENLSLLHATINGTVSAQGEAALSTIGASLDLVIGSSGRIESENGTAVEAGRNSSISNHGVVRSETGYAIILEDVVTGHVENWGTIYGRQVGIGYFSAQNAIVVNHGLLETHWGPAVYSDAGTTSLVNDGTIRATARLGEAVQFAGATFGEDKIVSIENSGSIVAQQGRAVVVSGSAVTLSNDGTIAGERGSLILSYSGDDYILNNGLLDGRAVLAGGNDVYCGAGGRIIGELWGQGGNDLLVGGDWSEIFGGGSGNDTLAGGGGADTLRGAAGNDVFRFATVGESIGDTILASDTSQAFDLPGVAGGDRIDVSSIDPNGSLHGNDPFIFGTGRGIGHLWAVDVGNVTHIRGNTTGSGKPDFDLAIHDGAAVHASDYTSLDFIL